MGSSGGGSAPATTTTIQKSELPAYVQPYAEQALRKGAELSDQPYQQYPGQQISPLTAEHQSALSGITNRAMQGSPLVDSTTKQLTDTQNGAYLNSNPYLDATYNKAARGLVDQYQYGIAPTIGKQFGHMEAFGNNSAYNESMGKAQQGLSTGLGDLAANIYGGNYEQERTRQIQAAALAPQIAGQDYQDMQALLGVGDVRRQASQDQLNLAYQEWMRQQQYPYQQLDVISNAIRGATGGGTQTSTAPNPYQPSPAAAMLGGGLAGAGIGSMINPAYAGYGAGAGAILPWIFK